MNSSMMPAAMFCSVPWSASPIARPAAASSAMMLVVWTPNWARTAISTSTRIPYRTMLAITGFSVLSSRGARFSTRSTLRRAQPATIKPTIRIASAPSTLSP